METSCKFFKCRACLNNLNKKIHLFDVFNECSTVRDGIRISDLFQKYTSILVTENDSLPEYICARCYKKLRDFHEFYKECNASNAKLLEQHLIVKQSRVYGIVKCEVEADAPNGDILDDIEVDQPEKVEANSDHGLEQTFSDESDFNVYNTSGENPTSDDSKRKNLSKAKYRCEICKKRFSVQHRYEAHMRQMHQGLKGYTCEICQNEFSSWKSYKRHMKFCHSANDEASSTSSSRYICDVDGCGKTFKLKS